MSYEEITKQLHAKGTELDGHLVKIKACNDKLLENSSMVLDELKNLVGTYHAQERQSCSVCYSRPPTHALVPCGHANLCFKEITRKIF